MRVTLIIFVEDAVKLSKDDVCPCCGKKFVEFPSSPLDCLGCPNCGSSCVEISELCDVTSETSYVLDLTCLDCDFKWVEGRLLPRRSRKH